MNKRRQPYGSETRKRLLEWDKGSMPSERLSALILHILGYSGIDPSHPLGGKDGLKDIILFKGEDKYIAACYFPRGQKKLTEIEKKFKEDFDGVHKNGAKGFIFVTNQELRLAERDSLVKLGGDTIIEIIHLERLTHVLETPAGYGYRLEYLQIEMTHEEQVSYQHDQSRILRTLSEDFQVLKEQHGKRDLPEVDLFFSGEVKKKRTFKLQQPKQIPMDDINTKMEELEKSYPKKFQPTNISFGLDKNGFLTGTANLASSLIPLEEYERYNDSVELFLGDYYKYLKNHWEWKQNISLALPINIEVQNKGRVPAKDIDILFDFPDSVSIFNEDELPSSPREPGPPIKPRHKFQIGMGDPFEFHRSRNLNSDFLRVPREFKLWKSFSVDRHKRNQAKGWLKSIKHGTSEHLDQFYLMFGSNDQIKSFVCNYKILIANFPEQITGELTFTLSWQNNDD